MPTYRVEFTSAAQKELRKLDPSIRGRIIAAAEGLARGPRPVGCKQLSGQQEPTFRVRIGDWRVVYIVRDAELLVLVIKLGHRREVYDR